MVHTHYTHTHTIVSESEQTCDLTKQEVKVTEEDAG